jgi:polar amino acid transport system permease protein
VEYHLNFNFVWKYADKLWWGLALSIQLAFVAILIGCVIGLALALAHSGGNRWTRGAVATYVEFIRNVPLLLLIYLVFYGIPSAGGFAYDATFSFVVTLSLYSGAYLVEVFRAGLDAVPKGVIDAGKAIGLTPWQRFVHVRLPIMLRVELQLDVTHSGNDRLIGQMIKLRVDEASPFTLYATVLTGEAGPGGGAVPALPQRG